jgi:hypothetical protein
MSKQNETTMLQSKDSSQLSWITSAADAYQLKRTLDQYEVEELDGHDLARLLPTMIGAGETEPEREPISWYGD